MIGLAQYKTEKDSLSVSSTLLPNTIIILVLIELLVEELMVVGSKSD